ncbi:MAG TPA: TolC family protein [Pseudomonadales bacterium]|nr:TolC family protein [Pseudomonadales bacterium]
MRALPPLLALLILGLSASAAARPAAEAAASPWLQIDEVLAASATHFPEILESLAQRRAADGRAQAAAGAFDLVFEADGFDRAEGFYDGAQVTGLAKRRLRGTGGTLYGGYSISTGDFPIYEDEYFTSTGGTLKAGVLFSLLRDREIDAQRFGEVDARFGVRQADLDVLLTRIGVQQRALVAYANWIAAGHQLGVYEELLAIAEERDTGLQEQVRRGARAAIFLTENRQNLTRRRSLVAAARRDFRMAANDLAWYYRDERGLPMTPDPGRLPPVRVIDDVEAIPGKALEELPATLMRRPELEQLRTAIERTRARMALNENALKPRLDLTLELAHGLGDEGDGGPSKDSSDAKVGLTFSVPLQQRTAKGELWAAQAELDAARQAQRLLEDRIEIEVRNIVVDLDAAQELLALAAQEVTQAETMKLAEQRRFENGASDFFLVNLREESAADARVRYIRADLERRVARANFDAATVDLDRLGLDSTTP